MKILKLSTLFAIVCLSLSVVAQEKKEAPKEVHKESEAKTVTSNGNADAMRRNLNYPNATNPADKNNQKYDKGTGRIENEHPKENLGNSYTRKEYEPKK